MEIIFDPNSKTIRQMPENYLLAECCGSRWICDPDSACNKDIAVLVFETLMIQTNKYGSGENLLSEITRIGTTNETIRVHDRSVEVVFGRGCNCDLVVDEVSRTLDELLYNEPVPKCPICETQFETVTVVVVLDKKING